MAKELVKSDWHLIPFAHFHPELSCLIPILLELLPVNIAIKVDSNENNMNAMNELMVDFQDV